MNGKIYELREIAENRWQAKYNGNYGNYTIKIVFNETGKRQNFSCSCPSDYYPCKHIAMVEEAIIKHLSKHKKIATETKSLTINDILNYVKEDELREFILKHAKYNKTLNDALILEFSHKARNAINPYNKILYSELQDIYFNEEDYYMYDECLLLDPLNEWYEKAQTCVKQEKYEDAILISQACIEEFAEWSLTAIETLDYLDTIHSKQFFTILHEIVKKYHSCDEKLYNYCKNEMQNPKYKTANMLDGFNDLMATLAQNINPAEFLSIQDKMLSEITDKTSQEAQDIMQRKIDFYLLGGQPEKAEEIIENNLQIKKFCIMTIEKRIYAEQYDEAKSLIAKSLKSRGLTDSSEWNKYILSIAQRENDIPTIRKTAFEFIKSYFDKKYYAIYQSTFAPEEWSDEVEKLIRHYEQNGSYGNRKSFNDSTANVFVAENLAERLLAYVEKYLSMDIIEKYYPTIAEKFPEKTLMLFRKTIDDFAQKNLGRDKYEYVGKLLRNMMLIHGGKTIVNQMIADYRVAYKNRRAMMEILNKL